MDIQDYRFGVLAVEIQNKDFIFVGSNYDDFNIKYYLNLYASTTFTSARGKLFFINPYPNLMFESEIEKIGGILLKYTTEDFAKILEDIAICKESMDEVKLEHDGYINIRTNKLKTNNQSGYNSDLFIELILNGLIYFMIGIFGFLPLRKSLQRKLKNLKPKKTILLYIHWSEKDIQENL